MSNIFIIAGCNGAGKTTASFTILPEMLNCKEFVNADEIAKGLSPFQPEKVSFESGRIILNRIKELLSENEKNNPEEGIPFYELFKLNNHPQYLESLIIMNADVLLLSSSKGKSEGADEAAKFYHRNLVMFSNLNQIPVTKDDRIFILMGGTHTAFFNEFIKRSPKFKLANTFEYLK